MSSGLVTRRSAKSISVTRTIASVVNVVRSGRPLPVRITHRIDYDGQGFSASLVRVQPVGTRRRVRLTWVEEDRALYRSLARLPI